MMYEELFRVVGLSAVKLDGEIAAGRTDEIEKQLRAVLAAPGARECVGIVYAWVSAHPAPRLRSESDVLYVGKTTGSIWTRYRSKLKAELAAWSVIRYHYILERHGPMRIFVARHENPIEAERCMLTAYYRDHLEAPPFNGNLPHFPDGLQWFA